MSAADVDRSGCVVVGIDGGYRSQALLPAGAREARRRGTALALVTVSRPIRDPDRTPRAQIHEEERNSLAAGERLRAAADAARTRYPDLEIITVVANEAQLSEHPPAVLRDAALLVLGTRGSDGRIAFGLESVSWSLLRAVHCPVLGVPDGAPETGHGADDGPGAGIPDAVVVAVGGPRDAEVVAAAVAEAGDTERIEIVHAYHPWPGESAEEALERAWGCCVAAAAAAGAAPGRITVTVTPDETVPALLRHAARARVLVVGTPGAGALAGLTRSSVSHQVLRAVERPVLVVPRAMRAHPPAADGAQAGTSG